jgi:thiol-disulfide isomerase/thioredoxin
MVSFRRTLALLLLLTALDAAPVRSQEAPPAARRQPPADAPAEDTSDDGGGRGVRLPPVPDGQPAEILAYVEKISDPAAMPRSTGRRRYYKRKVAAAYAEAAAKILAQVKPDDPLYLEAVQLGLDGFATLKALGEEKGAAAGRLAFARTLLDSPNAEVARMAKRVVLAAEVDAVYESRSAEGAGRLIQDLAALLVATKSEARSAQIAAQLASDLEMLPDGTDAARRALETFLPLFAASEDPLVRVRAEEGEAVLRRLSLPGKPLALEGTRLDGTPFDPRRLAGKVVLVDFWATWCGPCVKEIPNLVALREKYGRHGFEVLGISLDDDRDALDAFLAEQKLPWPVLWSGKATRDPLAVRYGIRSIPCLFLVGRDGNVLSVNARGERLEKLLAELFPDVR